MGACAISCWPANISAASWLCVISSGASWPMCRLYGGPASGLSSLTTMLATRKSSRGSVMTSATTGVGMRAGGLIWASRLARWAWRWASRQAQAAGSIQSLSAQVSSRAQARSSGRATRLPWSSTTASKLASTSSLVPRMVTDQLPVSHWRWASNGAGSTGASVAGGWGALLGAAARVRHDAGAGTGMSKAMVGACGGGGLAGGAAVRPGQTRRPAGRTAPRRRACPPRRAGCRTPR